MINKLLNVKKSSAFALSLVLITPYAHSKIEQSQASSLQCNASPISVEAARISPEQACLYLGAGINASKLNPSSNSPDWRVFDDNDTGWSLNAGWRFSPKWFAEIKHANQGEAFVSDRTSEADIEFNTSSLMFGLNIANLTEQLSLYIKGGAARTSSSSQDSVISLATKDTTDLAGGLGVEYRWPSLWFMRLNADIYNEDIHTFELSLQRYLSTPKISLPKLPTFSEPKTQNNDIARKNKKLKQSTACAKLAGTFQYIQFKAGSSLLSTQSRNKLQEYANTLKQFPNTVILVSAHTDSSGDGGFNLWLSNRRAKSVKSFLVSSGINNHQIETEGFGESRPIADNYTTEGRSINRRVEFSIIRSNKCL